MWTLKLFSILTIVNNEQEIMNKNYEQESADIASRSIQSFCFHCIYIQN